METCDNLGINLNIETSTSVGTNFGNDIVPTIIVLMCVSVKIDWITILTF